MLSNFPTHALSWVRDHNNIKPQWLHAALIDALAFLMIRCSGRFPWKCLPPTNGCLALALLSESQRVGKYSSEHLNKGLGYSTSRNALPDWEMAQPRKSWPHKHMDLSLDPSHPWNKPGPVGMCLWSQCWEVERSLELSSKPAFPNWCAPGFT